MKKTVAWLAVGCCALLLVFSTGCNGMKLREVPENSKPETIRSKVDLLPSVEDISSLITQEEMEKIIETTCTYSQDPNDGRKLNVFFESAENESVTNSVSINITENNTIEKFRSLISNIEEQADEELEALPNLAEEAWWMTSGHVAYVFSHGYVISINLAIPDWYDEDVLIAARQIAATICGRLPTE